jgi:hypothetical protein
MKLATPSLHTSRRGIQRVTASIPEEFVMPLCGVTFDKNGVAQTAAFGGLRLFASESQTAADQPKNGWSALHSLLVYS